jgi:hypothetical protein
LCCADNNGLGELGMEAGEGGDSGGKVSGQVANTASERQQVTTAGRGVLPKPADAVCGQQRAYGDIALREDEEAGEPQPEESGEREAVSDFHSGCGRSEGFTRRQEPFFTGRERHQAIISFG